MSIREHIVAAIHTNTRQLLPGCLLGPIGVLPVDCFLLGKPLGIALLSWPLLSAALFVGAVAGLTIRSYVLERMADKEKE